MISEADRRIPVKELPDRLSPGQRVIRRFDARSTFSAQVDDLDIVFALSWISSDDHQNVEFFTYIESYF